MPSHLSHLAEQHNPMPLGLRHQLPGLAILVTLVCGEVQVNHSVAVGGIASVRVLPQVTNENYLVYASCHRMLLIMFCGVPAIHASILCLSTLTLPDKVKVRKLIFPKMLTVHLQVGCRCIFNNHNVLHARQPS